ncbi:transporter substrate-binding domain-containing protein [bacterium]|nr:transporter substrate-binding domain-containing protein [bacterium]
MKRPISIILLLVCSIIILAAESKACELKVGWEPWPPFQFENSNGVLNGLDIELLNILFDHMQCKPLFFRIRWTAHLERIKNGTMDLAASASWSEERAQYAYFSKSYRTEEVGLFIRKGESKKYPFKSLEDIIGSEFTLGATEGYYYGDLFEQLVKTGRLSKNVKFVEDTSYNFHKLAANRIDGFLMDHIAAIHMKKEIDPPPEVERHAMEIYSCNIYIMFSKKSVSPETVDLFNLKLAEIRKEGIHAQIMKKYIDLE